MAAHAGNAVDAPVATPLRARWAVRRLIKLGILLLVLIAGAVLAWRYWRHAQLYASTDNAYVNADVVQIAAQDSGPVERLEVRDQQHVEAGDLLFVIDPRPFVLAVEGARAELALAAQQMGEQTAAVDAAHALVEQRRAERDNAEANNRRLRDLVRQVGDRSHEVPDRSAARLWLASPTGIRGRDDGSKDTLDGMTPSPRLRGAGQQKAS